MKVVGPNGLVLDLDPMTARGLLASRNAKYRLVEETADVEGPLPVAPPRNSPKTVKRRPTHAESRVTS